MTKAPKTTGEIDPEVLRVGEAVKTLRERIGLTQAQAADACDPIMTSQYWGMHETGRVPGIFKPATQRKLVDALNAAAGDRLAEPVTLQDLEDVIRVGPGVGEPPARFDRADGRAARLARELDRPDPNTRRAVFPTPDGDAVIEIPAHLTPEGFKMVEAYLAVFLKGNAPKG